MTLTHVLSTGPSLSTTGIAEHTVLVLSAVLLAESSVSVLLALRPCWYRSYLSSHCPQSLTQTWFGFHNVPKIISSISATKACILASDTSYKTRI